MRVEASVVPVGDRSWPRGGGEMGARVRAHDWCHNFLGPIEAWPVKLKSIVEFTLASSLPTKILWGPELIQIYNDAFAAIIGDKHPAGLGQRAAECWAEILHLSAPLYARALAGETLTVHNQNWNIFRNGLEEISFMAYLTPLRDDSGAIAGLHVIINETTGALKAARRVALLSPREREVLDRLAAGYPNKTIAAELGLSVRTVEIHRSRMMHRLGVRHVADAIRIAVTAQLAGQNVTH